MSLNFNFSRPVSTSVTAKVSGGWGLPRPDNRRHAGIDISLKTGTPILAIADGVVIKSQKTDVGDAGIWVGIQHPVFDSGGNIIGTVASRSLHFSKALVNVGDRVVRGQVIGLSGATGDSSGPHLHLDLKLDPALKSLLVQQVGTPVGGFLPLIEGYGFGIPAEPWIPVDSYNSRTIKEAKANKIPLYLHIKASQVVEPVVQPKITKLVPEVIRKLIQDKSAFSIGILLLGGAVAAIALADFIKRRNRITVGLKGNTLRGIMDDFSTDDYDLSIKEQDIRRIANLITYDQSADEIWQVIKTSRGNRMTESDFFYAYKAALAYLNNKNLT